MTIGHEGSEDELAVRPDGGTATQRLREAQSTAVISRRGVLWKAGIATAVGVAGLASLDEQRAQAASGGNFLLGSFNNAAGPTELEVTAGSTVGFSQLMVLNGTGVTVTALDVTGPSGGTAVYGHVASGVGSSGVSTSGTGVSGSSTTGSGVTGTSSSGTGVVGTSSTGDGVHGNSAANGKRAVVGTDTSAAGGTAVSGVSSHGLALSAASSTGGGVQVTAPTFHLRLTSGATRNAPTADSIAHQRGDMVESTAGDLWLCTTAGTPGTWRKLAGPASAGAFHLLPTPVRIYDSRPGTLPAVGSKTPLSGNVARVLDATVNSSGVPKGATGIMVTVLLVNASQSNANMTLWTNGASKPSSNTMVWGKGSGRYSTTAVTAIDANATLQVAASSTTDIVLDVVGYYR
jgi:hypothetical protein